MYSAECIVYKLMLSVYIILFRIGKCTGYKLSELSGLSEGSTLVVGGKEIEVHVHAAAHVHVYMHMYNNYYTSIYNVHAHCMCTFNMYI